QLLGAVGNAGLDGNGNILAAFHVLLQDSIQVNVTKDVAVGQYDIVLQGVFQENHGGSQGFYLTPVAAVVPHGEGRQIFQPAFFQLQIPFLAGADMIHQGLVVILCDDSDVPDAGVGHIGQGEVDLAVPSAVGQGC